MSLKTKVLYLASSVAFMRSFAQVIYTPTQAEITKYLGITAAIFGLTISVYALSFAVSQLAFGPLVDRFESKRILLGGITLLVLGSLVAFLAPQLAPILASRAIQAIGIAAAGLVAIALISDVVPQAERGRAMGVYEVFNAAGAASGPIVGAIIATWLGWRYDFLFLAVLGILLVVFAAWGLPKLPVKSQKVGFKDMLTILRTPSPAGAIVLGLVMFYGLFTMFQLLPLFFAEQYGMTVSGIGLMVALTPLGAMLGSYLGGRMLDRNRVRHVALPGALGAALTFGGLTYLSSPAGSTTPVLIVAGSVFLCGTMIGYCLPAQLKIMVDFFPSMRGTASGLLIFFRFIGASLAPILTGYLADHVSITTGFASAAILLTIGTVVAFVVIAEPQTSPVTVSIE